jgi:hypothetical protein
MRGGLAFTVEIQELSRQSPTQWREVAASSISIADGLPCPHMITFGTVMTHENSISRMMSLWSAVLGHNDYDATSDFLAAGGNSLLALNLQSHINHEYGIRVALLDVLQASTPRAMAALVDTLRMSDAHSDVHGESA